MPEERDAGFVSAANDAQKKLDEKAAAEAAQKKAADVGNQTSDMQMMAQAENAYQDMLAKRARQAAESENAAAVVKHVWTSEDTYAGLAFKFYGSIQEPYWRLIYNHNKDIIGNHPNDIRVGLEIEIPPLPDELKKK